MKAFITLTYSVDNSPLKLNPLAIESFYKEISGNNTIIVCTRDPYYVKETVEEVEAIIEEWMKHQVGTLT